MLLFHEALQEVRDGNDAIPLTIHHDREALPYSEPDTVDEVPEPEDPPPQSVPARHVPPLQRNVRLP